MDQTALLRAMVITYQEYFADGVAEDVITALSRMGWLFVTARNSSQTYLKFPA